MKATYTQLFTRKILLAFIALIIILAIAALFVRNSISKKLEHTSKMANSFERDERKPEEILLLIHQAEDDFQEALLNSDTTKSMAYKEKLALAFQDIDNLLKANMQIGSADLPDNDKVKALHQRKLDLSDKLYTLKHSFDSLLTSYSNFGLENRKEVPIGMLSTERIKRAVVATKADTVRKEVLAKRKGLFSRLKDAIANNPNVSTSKEIIEINHNQTNSLVRTKTNRLVNPERENKRAYLNQLQQLQQRNIKLLSMQRELISLNSRITSELELIINEVKDINYSISDQFKTVAFRSYQESTALLNKFYLVALFLVVIFAALLIVFIVKLNKSELLLRAENKRAVVIAQQKMDLLSHMSHEIRNPLTAIKGFLYIFSKTELSKRQADMLESIRSSSDMLLSTLNDTLDAAKMENSEFKINCDPYSPDLALKEVVESMEFSAAKKKLQIAYEFIGNSDVILMGDSFRLKQILINLLSNAIKYTQAGSITVRATLIEEVKERKIQVDVIDTGAGISAEQQAKLFSKYYQTNSAKGNIGTGLGLYICKKFVELQGGKISVKSVAGSGSTFSFYIRSGN
ncbi:HAMP domain-containing sensor histidine kinase [Pedobacter sp. MC2016-24]|uniref:sensor histidine kinase n=1 Tax=Pedobacter sp. MC2016-24 TaxID=2780090 RepID=UPI001881B1A8|nr:HAMP domain-containing sensor histidine kinase [Pedobacter sp. MC2016-24]MBE9598130.1 HAMP domain-containing histidine kinase [Pedobacter sp. MC2016-24]